MKRSSSLMLPLLCAVLVTSLACCLIALAWSRSEALYAGESMALCCLVLLTMLLVPASRQSRRTQKALQNLLEERRQLAEIIELLPDAAWAIDAGGTVIAWNRAIEELTGVQAREMVGLDRFAYSVPFYGERRPILVDVAIAPNPEQELKYDSFSRKGSTVEAEIYIPHFGENGLYLWARARPLLDGSGQVIGAIETLRDVTEKRRLQEVMMQTEKMLTVGGLAAGMAHEINNPLAAILQNSQNLQRRLSPGLAANDRAAAEFSLDFEAMQCYLKQRGIFELLEVVEAAGTRISGVVDKMMFFSHKNSAILEPVHLEQLIDEALDLVACDYDLKKRCEFRSDQIVREYDRQLPVLVLNRAEMEQALINLIKNAIHALAGCRPGETPRITIRTRRNGAWASTQIEDNGCGMTPEVKRRMFEPFYTTKDVGVGTGLGMAVTYAVVVKNHHGSIEVDSAPGRGSKVTVNLPLAAAPGSPS